MTQSYGLPTVVPCQKNTVGSWNQPEAGRQEDVGLKAGAADASSGNGKQRNSPGAWPSLRAHRADTGEKHPGSSPKTRAQNTPHWLLLSAFHHRFCSSQSACLPWHSSTEILSRSLSFPWLWRFDACMERIVCLFWMEQPLQIPFKGVRLRKEIFFFFLTSEIMILPLPCSVWVFHSCLICMLNYFFSAERTCLCHRVDIFLTTWITRTQNFKNPIPLSERQGFTKASQSTGQ